jgi:hypothetical protein
VACGAPAAERSPLRPHRLVSRGHRQEDVDAKLDVPHCARCAKLTRSIFLVGCVPAALGGLLVGAAAFAAAYWLATVSGLDDFEVDEGWPSLILGGVAGLLGGLLGAFVAELAARLFLLPFFGRALLSAPLLTAQMLGDSDYVVGLAAKLAPDGRSLELRFADDAQAQAFAALNRLPAGPAS